MKITILTPTYERENYLQGTYQLLQKQRHANWEWLIYDSSLRATSFEDPRVIYLHDPAILSIGEKRNRLKARATGDLIVHFDDDDYYAPTYLETIQQRLTRSDFCTLHAWFSYDAKTGQFYYWNTEELGEVRYFVNSISGSCVREVNLGPLLEHQKAELNEKGKKGYGFSFAYRKEVADRCFFEDLDLAEDRNFFEAVQKRGFAIETWPCEKGEVIHVVHHTNTSGEFPQYRIPHFLIRERFADFLSYAATIHPLCAHEN